MPANINPTEKKPFLKTALTVIVSFAIAALFMWWALQGMELERIAGYFAQADYLWVAVAAVFGLLAYWFRAVRWNLLLEPLGHRISTSNSFWTISFGYLMNLTIPRSGELARSTALFSVEKVPVDESFGTIILERVVDLLCMLLFLALALVFRYQAILSFYDYLTAENDKAGTAGQSPALYVLAALGAVFLILFLIFRQRIQRLPIYQKILCFISGIVAGLLSVFRLRQKGLFLVYTLAIWVCYYLAAYLICFALPETSQFGLADGFFIIVVGTMGMMVPASGGIGAFHLALKFGIMALFLSMGKDPAEGGEVGLSYAFISHTMQLVIMLVMGVVSIPVLARARAVRRV